MAHIPEKQICIQSKFMDVWKVNEYQKLVLLVSKLCLCPDTDQEIIGQLYTETFYNQNVSDISNLYNINLDNVPLNVYTESDSENNYLEQETEEIVNEESEPVKSAKKTKIKPHRLSTSNSTPPSLNKNLTKNDDCFHWDSNIEDLKRFVDESLQLSGLRLVGLQNNSQTKR